MASSNPGYEVVGDDEILFYPPLPPHLEPPYTSFFGAFPQNIGQDLSFLLADDYNQISPNLFVEDRIITREAIELGQEEPNGKGDPGDQVGTVSSSSSVMMMMKQRKIDHNEKERVRRLHLNTTYLALRSLLPDSHNKPKKKWSTPYLIDRAVEHIPHLESDVEKLKSKKKELLSRLHNQKLAEEAKKQDKIASVSVNEIKRGEVIIQICHQRNNDDDVLWKLLEKLESEGIKVLNVSVFDPCQDRYAHHIHVQMGDMISLGADYVGELKEKVVNMV